MAKVIVEPDEVKRFARELARFREELESGMGHITARMNALGETWRDQEHRKFADEFEQTLRLRLKQDSSKISKSALKALARKAACTMACLTVRL